MRTIDLNADLGETVAGAPTADDEALFALVSSANVACGAHAGDAAAMRQASERARRYGVAVGAHPSYADAENFGRVRRDPPPNVLRREVAAQIAALADAGAEVRYVKPHGALYHAVTVDAAQADAVAAAVADAAAVLGRALPILGLDGEIARAAGAVGLPFRREAFLDRGYASSGALVPRGEPGDLLHDPAEVAERAVRLVREGVVRAVDGTDIAVDAVSLCVHGDTPAAVAMAAAVRTALADAGIRIAAPW
jgi:5-oxoprolinase (ATP-hydrolysing) subunit A